MKEERKKTVSLVVNYERQMPIASLVLNIPGGRRQAPGATYARSIVSANDYGVATEPIRCFKTPPFWRYDKRKFYLIYRVVIL